MRDLVHSFLQWYLSALESGGYPLIAFLMALESSIVPLPSEVVIPPAAYVAHTRGTMSLAGIVIAGTIGSWIGATIMYHVARWLGRPLLMRYGRYFTITPDKIERAEAWAARFGMPGIFVSRLLPVIRHLIGIPAGIVRMGGKIRSPLTRTRKRLPFNTGGPSSTPIAWTNCGSSVE